MSGCYHCGYEFSSDMRVTRTVECPQCSRPVRCCRNCTFYEPGAHWDCRETIPDPVFDKERANFCDYFRLAENGPPNGSPGRSAEELHARSAFDSLFS